MFLLGSLSSGTVVSRGTAGSRARRRSSTAPLPGHAAAAHGTGVAVPPIAEELLTLTAPLMPRTEPVLTAARLANRKVGRRALGRRLALGARQRGANQRTMDGTVHVVVLSFPLVVLGIRRCLGRRLLAAREL